MNRVTATLLFLLSSAAHAADLRVYPTFAEVRQPLTAAPLSFPPAQWRWIQPGSVTVLGAAATPFSLRPLELDWLRAQEGQPVTWRRAGQPALAATLERADDLLLRLESGGFVRAALEDLTFSSLPPVQGGVTFRLNGPLPAGGTLSYRTAALSWTPRYELRVGTPTTLSALAQITNRSDQVFTAEHADLFGGTVRQVSAAVTGTLTNAAAGDTLPVPVMPASAGRAEPINVGEVRGLQRYALPGGLTVGRGEQLTLPFLKPQVGAFTRYGSVQSYLNGTGSSGQVNRQYKFTPSVSLPAGTVDVREGDLLVGSVTLPAAQAGAPIDLNLGADPDLRYVKRVQQLSQEKSAAGQVVSTTWQVTYSFTSRKSAGLRVNVREQVYGRSVSVDGGAPQPGQVTVTRQVQVPAQGQASLTVRIKVMN
ncbi:hypothetical protein GCM10008959_39020 [Deinococcus seoulensis]|uniref:DUF4139 domain-containing protein n=1 Tax=Deinococcus seoulensis TaxID=1837379 RepID=A0ABQ2RZ55_9DEIO|nr:hypothetical protein [Deinococcus seoulensis]GGR73940.1 hypothetical protein GCM10008959_39020 [Deinococcus seoulensis]